MLNWKTLATVGMVDQSMLTWSLLRRIQICLLDSISCWKWETPDIPYESYETSKTVIPDWYISYPIKDSISQKLSPDWQMRSSLIAPCLARRQQAGDDGILRIANHLPDGKIVKLCCWRCWFQPAFPHLSAIFRLDQTAERLELYRNARWV